MNLKLTAAILLAVSTTACASITRGTKDVFIVETTPSGASVKTTNQFACDATPCSFEMPRKSEFDVTISKDGYKSSTHHITNKVVGAGSAGMAGNLLFGGVIGAGVDVYSGAMKDLTPNPLVVTLDAEGEETDTTTITIDTSDIADTNS